MILLADCVSSVQTMASPPLPLSTAIYAINDRARLQANESILIHYNSYSSDAGAVVPAIRIAQKIGAQVFVVCGTAEDQEQLLRNSNLPQDHVFTTGDATLVTKLMRVTGSQGVDVVVSFSDDQLDPAILADCARLVQVGSGVSGLADTVAADPSVLYRNITLTTFDMGSLIARRTPGGQLLRQRLLADAITLYRSSESVTSKTSASPLASWMFPTSQKLSEPSLTRRPRNTITMEALLSP
jgi:NADPH:quinone reductase-like Zn-dependent oxidoreductase